MRINWRAAMGIGLVGVYSLVMMTTGGSAPHAWAILAVAGAMLLVEARSVSRGMRVHRD